MRRSPVFKNTVSIVLLQAFLLCVTSWAASAQNGIFDDTGKIPPSYSNSNDSGQSLRIQAENAGVIEARPDGFYKDGKRWFELGANWRGVEYGWNFGDRKNGLAKFRYFTDRVLSNMEEVGIKKVRVGLLDDARNLKRGFKAFKKDIKVFLDAAEKHDIKVEFTLFDYLAIAKGNFKMKDKKIKRFIRNFLTPFLKKFGDHPALMSIDLINEPEWILKPKVPGGVGDKMKGKRKPIGAKAYYNFVAKLSKAIKRKTDGRVLVTIGTSFTNMETVTVNKISRHIDYYELHWYPWMSNDGQYSLDNWIGQVPKDKPWILGEYPTRKGDMSPAQYLDTVMTNGGTGADAWNWELGVDKWTSRTGDWHEDIEEFRDAHQEETQ